MKAERKRGKAADERKKMGRGSSASYLGCQTISVSREILRRCSTRHGEDSYEVGFHFQRLDFTYLRKGDLTLKLLLLVFF